MRRFALCVVLAVSAGLVNAGCQGNNCVRAVTGTRADQTALHRSDCSSFLAVTVTPTPVTATVTQTITPFSTVLTTRTTSTAFDTSTTTQTLVQLIEDRQIARRATSVPPYATACAGAAQYSSACSCWGVTASTSTAPTPTHTVTVTASATATRTTLVATTTTSTAIATDTVCPPPATLCSGQCVQTRWDPTNCGTCGTMCAPGRSCQNGFCLDCDPDRSCPPKVATCGNAPGCECLLLQEGGICVSEVRGTCVAGVYCQYSLDCPPGSVCRKGWCGPGGCANNYCVEVIKKCANTLLPVRLFARGLEADHRDS